MTFKLLAAACFATGIAAVPLAAAPANPILAPWTGP